MRIRKYKQLIERVRVVGPIEKRNTAISKLIKEGYSIISTRDSVALSKFVVVAEKTVKDMSCLSSIELTGMSRIVGAKLIHAEHRTAEGHNASGGEEVWMDFDNGGELLIYQSCDGVIWVEGD